MASKGNTAKKSTGNKPSMAMGKGTSGKRSTGLKPQMAYSKAGK